MVGLDNLDKINKPFTNKWRLPEENGDKKDR